MRPPEVVAPSIPDVNDSQPASWPLTVSPMRALLSFAEQCTRFGPAEYDRLTGYIQELLYRSRSTQASSASTAAVHPPLSLSLSLKTSLYTSLLMYSGYDFQLLTHLLWELKTTFSNGGEVKSLSSASQSKSGMVSNTTTLLELENQLPTIVLKCHQNRYALSLGAWRQGSVEVTRWFLYKGAYDHAIKVWEGIRYNSLIELYLIRESQVGNPSPQATERGCTGSNNGVIMSKSLQRKHCVSHVCVLWLLLGLGVLEMGKCSTEEITLTSNEERFGSDPKESDDKKRMMVRHEWCQNVNGLANWLTDVLSKKGGVLSKRGKLQGLVTRWTSAYQAHMWSREN